MRTDPAFQPGDPPPEGYIAWHSWAAVQHKAGLRQRRCAHCGRWYFPQERDATATAAAGHPLCQSCATAPAAPGPAPGPAPAARTRRPTRPPRG